MTNILVQYLQTLFTLKVLKILKINASTSMPFIMVCPMKEEHKGGEVLIFHCPTTCGLGTTPHRVCIQISSAPVYDCFSRCVTRMERMVNLDNNFKIQTDLTITVCKIAMENKTSYLYKWRPYRGLQSLPGNRWME